MVVPAAGGKQCQGEQRPLGADCFCPARWTFTTRVRFARGIARARKTKSRRLDTNYTNAHESGTDNFDKNGGIRENPWPEVKL
jgi:hypothetical protein